MVNVKPVKLGNTERMSFGKIDEVIDMPNLIEVQKESYRWFLEEGLKEVFKDVSGITDYQDNLVLDFIDYTLDVDHPNYSVIECKVRDATYSAALRVTARLLNKSTGEIKESNVFMGDFPLMTPSGTFVINGAERVIVSQLVRSPGVYYKMDHDKTGKELYSTTVIPNRGAWLEYETDVNDVFCVTSGCLTMACDERLADIEGEICVDDAPVFMNADAEALGANKAVSLSTKDGNVLLVDYASAGRGKERPFMAAWIKRKQ